MRAADLATQSVGEASEIVEGVWQIKLPVPFPLGFVSVYLVEGDDGCPDRCRVRLPAGPRGLGGRGSGGRL